VFRRIILRGTIHIRVLFIYSQVLNHEQDSADCINLHYIVKINSN